jgi:hypothetical protein
MATTTNYWPVKSALTVSLFRAVVQNLCLYVTHKQERRLYFFQNRSVVLQRAVTDIAKLTGE